MIWSASSNSFFERWLMSPVWIMKDGLAGIALIFATASRRVASASGFAGLSKPTWLSLICRNVRALLVRALAASALARPIERGRPPLSIQRTPVPAQVMHARKPRRLMPSSSGVGFWFVGSFIGSPPEGFRPSRPRPAQLPVYSRLMRAPPWWTLEPPSGPEGHGEREPAAAPCGLEG